MTQAQQQPAFVLPAALLSQGYALRRETDDDLPFLMRLFASTRERELAPMPWSTEQKRDFLASQFEAQSRHYRTFIAGGDYLLVEHHGAGAGRLYLDMRRTSLHIVDIALMPDWRGKGLGTAILEALQDFGRMRGMAIGIFVEKFNPALRLYRRLGFAEIADHDVYLEMEWTPDALNPETPAAAYG
ncbi:MAG: GNAT family N-acetyltransferase [Pseudolabrys sp.]|nr:GNAT family N-acetyltransferase [Pseudolabrys sp.]MDP2295535.1 GNAT family N-acetyltransferase [Pseudolabrys sp.]